MELKDIINEHFVFPPTPVGVSKEDWEDTIKQEIERSLLNQTPIDITPYIDKNYINSRCSVSQNIGPIIINNPEDLKEIEKIEDIEFKGKKITFPEPLFIERPKFRSFDDETYVLVSVIEKLVEIINVERGGKEIFE